MPYLNRQSPDDFIFGDVDWIKDAWPTVCREAKIENLHFHDLRATYVTRILEAGYDSFTARDAAFDFGNLSAGGLLGANSTAALDVFMKLCSLK
ncbi:MAG: hypothetical protein U0X75_06250 [Acidobacteriota bacterium]